MRCESCRAGDSECHAWIACDGPITPRHGLATVANTSLTDHRADTPGEDRGCTLVYEVGFDEDDPYTEPRRVLVCEVHG